MRRHSGPALNSRLSDKPTLYNMCMIAGRFYHAPAPVRLLCFFCMVGALSAQTAGDALRPEFPVDSELYALMTDHLGTDTGPESICGIGSVIGRPFVAARVVTSLQKDTASREESPEAPHRYLIARDRFGRVRCEIGYIEPDFEAVHKRVKLGTYVYDPVGQTHTSMYPESFHSAFVIPFTLMDPIFAKVPRYSLFAFLRPRKIPTALESFGNHGETGWSVPQNWRITMSMAWMRTDIRLSSNPVMSTGRKSCAAPWKNGSAWMTSYFFARAIERGNRSRVL